MLNHILNILKITSLNKYVFFRFSGRKHTVVTGVILLTPKEGKCKSILSLFTVLSSIKFPYYFNLKFQEIIIILSLLLLIYM